MSDTPRPTPRPTPRLTPDRHGEQVARAERLARALRENLHRRKEQARARVTPADLSPAEPDGDEPPA